MSSKEGHLIEATNVTRAEVKIRLANGVDVHISSNDGYLNIHFSGLGPDHEPIQVRNQYANGINIKYTKMAS